MTRRSPIFSSRTTKPDGRKGRRPATVRISRSALTRTGGSAQPAGVLSGRRSDGRAWRQRDATATAAEAAAVPRNVRRFIGGQAYTPEDRRVAARMSIGLILDFGGQPGECSEPWREALERDRGASVASRRVEGQGPHGGARD